MEISNPVNENNKIITVGQIIKKNIIIDYINQYLPDYKNDIMKINEFLHKYNLKITQTIYNKNINYILHDIVINEIKPEVTIISDELEMSFPTKINFYKFTNGFDLTKPTIGYQTSDILHQIGSFNNRLKIIIF